MNKTIYITKSEYLFAGSLALILSLCFIKSPILTGLFLWPFVLGIVLHKKIKVLLILTILYILFFYTLTTILWSEYLPFIVKGRGYLKIIYNPFLICILVGFLMYLVLNINNLLFIFRTKLKEFKMIKVIFIELLILIVFLIFNYSFIKINGGYPDIASYINNFFMPVTMFIAVIIAIIKKDLEKSFLIRILKITLSLLLSLVCFGVYEFAMKENFLFENLQTVGSFIWNRPYFIFNTQSPYRIFTFIGHPLRNASIFMVAALFSLSMNRKRFFLFITFIIATILTFSRSAIIVIPPLVLLFFVIKKEQVIGRRMLLICIVVLICVSIYFLPLKQSIETRFKTSEASTEVRWRALKYAKNTMFENIPNLLLGKSGGESREVSKYVTGEGVSFEIPWIMMAIDKGIIVAFMYIFVLGQILIVLFKKIKRDDAFSIILFLVVLGLLIQLSAYNGIVSFSPSSLFLWYIITIAIGYHTVNLTGVPISRLKKFGTTS